MFVQLLRALLGIGLFSSFAIAATPKNVLPIPKSPDLRSVNPTAAADKEKSKSKGKGFAAGVLTSLKITSVAGQTPGPDPADATRLLIPNDVDSTMAFDVIVQADAAAAGNVILMLTGITKVSPPASGCTISLEADENRKPNTRKHKNKKAYVKLKGQIDTKKPILEAAVTYTFTVKVGDVAAGNTYEVWAYADVEQVSTDMPVAFTTK